MLIRFLAIGVCNFALQLAQFPLEMNPFQIIWASSLTLCLSQIANAASFPKHSWATLPVFLHTSDIAHCVWTPTDLDIAARFASVTIEKWQGCGQLGPTQEECTLSTAAALRALRPNISAFIWYDSLRIYSNKTFNPDIINIMNQSCVRNEHTPFLETHKNYLLSNVSGLPALESYLHAHVYDHRQAIVRDYWKDACVALVTPTSDERMDGCGADASQQNGTYIRNLDPAVAEAWTTAHVEAVQATTMAVSSLGGVILGKLPVQLGVSTNGILQEGCNGNNITITSLRAAAALASTTKSRLLFECHSDSSSESSMAAFLIGAGVDQYWGFGPWVTQAGGFESSWLAEYEHPLGEPSSDATYDSTTSIWSRIFASGTSVTFNAKTEQGTITWGQGN